MAGYDLAKELAGLITDYVDYGDHEAEFHRLQENLQPTESSCGFRTVGWTAVRWPSLGGGRLTLVFGSSAFPTCLP